MKKLSFLLVAVMALTMSSCINLLEELTLKKDGSGSYNLTFDMSSLMSDDFLKGMLQESAKENEATKELSENLEKDTIIFLKDMPMEAKQKTGRPEFWNNVKIHMKMSEKEEKFFTSIQLNFDKLSDIDFFYKNLSTLMEENAESMGNGMIPNELLPGGALFKYDKKKLVRLPAPKSQTNAAEDENMEMFKMFFSSATYTSVYNLPGRVTKTNMADAEIDGNTVKVSSSLMDMMEGKSKAQGEIRFK